MGNLTDRAAYLRGLAEGMGLDKEKNEHKLLLEMLGLMDEMAQKISDLDADVGELEEYVEDLDSDLSDMEETLYRRPGMRVLFDAVKDAPDEVLQQTIDIIEVLKNGKKDNAFLTDSDYCVRLIDLDTHVRGVTAVDENGFASVYINARQAQPAQCAAFLHELEHIKRDDFSAE